MVHVTPGYLQSLITICEYHWSQKKRHVSKSAVQNNRRQTVAVTSKRYRNDYLSNVTETCLFDGHLVQLSIFTQDLVPKP